jgi:outer membrane protein OmpA-like peptidoglycan-associated protein
MNKIYSTSVLVSALALSLTTAKAQQNLTLYNMPMVQQSQYANPAIRPEARLNIGALPGLTSNYLNFANSGFTLSQVVREENGKTKIDLNNMLNKLGKKNILSLTGEVDLLSFGFKQKQNYWSFSVIEKIDTRTMYRKDLFSFLILGNAHNDNIGETLNLGIKADANAYAEVGLGFNRIIKEDKLIVGGKLKVLFGQANLYTKRANTTIKTDKDSLDITVASDVAIYASYINDTKSLFTNKGLGLDLGAQYNITPKIKVSASVIDLGSIHWKTNTVSAISDNPNATATFKGVDISQYFLSATSTDTSAIENGIQKNLDSLAKEFNITVDTTSKKAYNSPLFTKMYLGGNYQLNKWSNASVLLYGQMYAKGIRPAVTLGYNVAAKHWLRFSLTYSMLNRSFANVGAGLSINLGGLQWHIVSDNVLGTVVYDKYTSGGSSFIAPSIAKTLNIRFGFNLAIGRKPQDRDKDGIVNKKDECPDTFGLLEFNGCPDKDGDKVPDKIDACPDVAGLKGFKGCPDTDADGVEDSKDACPTVAGDKAFSGCPDTDKDGIEDSKDKCPKVAGLAQFEGCPDTDKDGIEDSKDECPTVAGITKYNGCPDTDNDGLADNKDLCPTEAGAIENKGCPYKDKDGDGLLDKDDKCPDVAGPKENNGCPLTDKDGDGVLDKDDECPAVAGPADNKGCPKIAKEDEAVLAAAFSNLEFETGKDVIKTTSLDELTALAELLTKKPNWKLKMSGHTDNQGVAKANLDLSKRRAAAVKKFLASKGIADTRLISEGFGQTKPVADNKTPEGRQRNRRVEMKVIFE